MAVIIVTIIMTIIMIMILLLPPFGAKLLKSKYI